MDTGGGEAGEGGMYAESNMETYITMCKIDSQGKFAIWLRKFLEGRDREEDGREF